MMPRRDGSWSGSRDFYLDVIACEVSTCPCNRNHHCISPASISIGADGRCIMAKKVEARAAPAPGRALRNVQI